MTIKRAVTYLQSEEFTKELVESPERCLGIYGWKVDGANKITLLELATTQQCYFFHPTTILRENSKFPEGLIKILQDPSFVKVGDNITALAKDLLDYNVTLESGLDLNIFIRTLDQTYVKKCMSNREIPNYSEKCLVIYKRLINNLETPDEENQYYDWITCYLRRLGFPVKMKSLINYTVNSYPYWRKQYNEDERRVKAEEYLTLFQDRIDYDATTTKFTS